MNLPNVLTIGRILVTPLFIILLFYDYPYAKSWALLIFVIAMLTDIFDGYYARKYNLVTDYGRFLDPLADKVMVLSALISFAVMPFKYEKERIFNSGVALKRVRENSQCTIVLDNDSLLESNPDLTAKDCYSIANSAISHIVKSLETTEISSETNILTTSKDGQSMEESLRDSLKMLYQNSPPNTVKSSMVYIAGGENIPVGVINSIKNLSNGITNESNSQINISSSEESKVVMLSSVQTMTKFDNYDPLGMIPKDQTLSKA